MATTASRAGRTQVAIRKGGQIHVPVYFSEPSQFIAQAGHVEVNRNLSLRRIYHFSLTDDTGMHNIAVLLCSHHSITV